MIAKHGEKIAVSLDVRGNVLAARGGTQVGGDLMQTLEMLEREGCQRYIVTDVTKDGTLQGPNISLLRKVCAKTKSPVIASGGVSTLEDIASLASLDIEGAIVGKALYAGAFTLQQALELTNTLAHSGGQ
jgi:phosphoribosylformimino-5-aminoimidazole carboxamide ribotide isomerase/phosphoribosylanthranilate isomerase